MIRFRWYFAGVLSGVALLLLAVILLLVCLADFLVVKQEPQSAEAIVILGGDGTRLRPGVRLFDQGTAPRLLLTGTSKGNWLKTAEKYCPDCRLEEKPAVYLDKATDTHNEAELCLQYCHENNLQKILVVTSPYHTRRTQFVFNDIFELSGIDPIVISSGDYTHYLTPDSAWWRHRHTVELVWVELGKILYWELTPFKDFLGQGRRS